MNVFLDWCHPHIYIGNTLNLTRSLQPNTPFRSGVSAKPPPPVRAESLLLGVLLYCEVI